MHYHIILTEICNSRCRYCYEKSMKEFDNGLEKKWEYEKEIPFDSEISIEKLKNFIKKEDTLIFYGGEPLLKLDKIKEIMDYIDCNFMIQTNAKLLDKLPTKYLKKMKKMLISIDGDENRTDYNRGDGTYNLVLKNVQDARKREYAGEIVIRMTLSFPDIYDQIMNLIELINEGLFDSIHWQIDAGFYKFDFDKDKFTKFVEEYNSQIDLLLDFWLSEMGKNSLVWKFYPFLGIYNSLKEKIPSKLQCGSGFANLTINTKGDLCACPIMNSVKNFYCGNIDEGIKKEIHITDEMCMNCDVYNICGGRCLYWHEAKLWPSEGDKLICKTIKHLIKKIELAIPKIEKFIEDGKIHEKDFEFEKYFGPEIIP